MTDLVGSSPKDKQQMTVLVLLTDLFDAVGGIQTFNRALVKALDEIAAVQSWQVSVLVLHDTGKTDLTDLYCRSGRTRYRGFRGRKLSFFVAAMREVYATSVVMLGHVNFTPLLLPLRARNRQLKSLLAVYGIDVWHRLPRFQRRSLKYVNRILSVSRSTRKRMAAANDLNGTPIDIVPCTLEPFYGKNVKIRSRKELQLPDGKMVLSTSRLDGSERYKGIDDVIRVLPTVLDRVPDAFYVVIGDGTDRVRLEQLTRDLGVKDKVLFTGRVTDELLPSYYDASDVFVLPSTREGFGIVFLEAMYHAKPCVGLRATSIPEVIEHGVTGILAEPGNTTQLADSIVTLLVDERLRLEMGDKGQSRLAREFSFESFKSNLESGIKAATDS